MAQAVAVASAQPCVWMCAGLVSYRLCSRDFDCEHCPLDAALRGELATPSHALALLYRRTGEENVPTDRFYSTGHTWAQRLDPGTTWRVGIDAFAAALVGNIAGITCDESEQVHVGDALCTIDLGVGILRIGSPLPGRVLRRNYALAERPNQLLADPYDEGWLAELAADESDAAGLLTADAARRQLALDLRQCRRAMAFRLLESVTTSPARDGPEAFMRDLRNIIAGDHYVECVSDFIH